MLEDIRNLSENDKIHRMILSTSLIGSIVNQSPYTPGVLGGTRQSVIGWGGEEQMTDDELWKLLQVISNRVYYITDSPTFEYMDNNMKLISCRAGTLSVLNPEELDQLISGQDYKNKFFIYYDVSKSQGRYNIRLTAIDDIIQIRDNKINDILGE